MDGDRFVEIVNKYRQKAIEAVKVSSLPDWVKSELISEIEAYWFDLESVRDSIEITIETLGAGECKSVNYDDFVESGQLYEELREKLSDKEREELALVAYKIDALVMEMEKELYKLAGLRVREPSEIGWILVVCK